jgi:hypothetical protein
VTNELCKQALEDARNQLHPLLQNTALERLVQRDDFLKAFKSALEQRIVAILVAWQPDIGSVFRFEETGVNDRRAWDGSIHLLVKVPQLSKAIGAFSKKLDRGLVESLNQLNWTRFRERQTILEIQQVTLNELRHGIGYGAMFCAVYNPPVKVWP